MGHSLFESAIIGEKQAAGAPLTLVGKYVKITGGEFVGQRGLVEDYDAPYAKIRLDSGLATLIDEWRVAPWHQELKLGDMVYVEPDESQPQGGGYYGIVTAKSENTLDCAVCYGIERYAVHSSNRLQPALWSNGVHGAIEEQTLNELKRLRDHLGYK